MNSLKQKFILNSIVRNKTAYMNKNVFGMIWPTMVDMPWSQNKPKNLKANDNKKHKTHTNLIYIWVTHQK